MIDQSEGKTMIDDQEEGEKGHPKNPDKITA